MFFIKTAVLLVSLLKPQKVRNNFFLLLAQLLKTYVLKVFVIRLLVIFLCSFVAFCWCK